MQTFRQFAFGTIAGSLFIASSVMSFADDPPSRVARLKYMSGEVSMQPGGVDDWASATINRPMTTADRLWTDKDSRAELHLGSAAMRMNSETSLTLTNLTDNTMQLELDQGTLNLHVARLHDGEIYEVDTPNMAFTLLKSGDYRFDVDSQGDVTLVTVWKGKGIATGDGDAVRIDSNHQVRFFGGMSLAHQTLNAPRLDGFDEWCRVRSDREGRIFSVRYVSPDVVGYEDLDEYGSWREIGTYGGVWFPTRVEVGWAPYRYGHWAWVEPWGWTWIDDAAWGFAPFHYGRWVFVTGRWGWVPGPVRVRPCYAPALVAWIGGSGAGVGVGWFPLGYGEPYIPYYRVSRNYFQTVNVNNTRITNITYVTNNYYNVNNVRINNVRYVNRTTATTIVNNDVMINSRRIDHNVLIDRDRDRHDSHDRWVTNGPRVPPSHDSVLGNRRDEHAPPARVMNKRVVMKLPPPERPVPFETKRADLDDHRGRPLDKDEENRLRKRLPVAHNDDDDHSRSVSDGGRNYPGPKQREENPGHNNGGQADNHGNRGSDRDDARLNDNSSAQWRDRRQPRRGNDRDDDHGQSASAGSNDPAPKQRDQNWHDSQGNQASHERDSQRDDSVAERRVPRPPRRNNDADGDHGQSNSGTAYNPAPKQRDQNPDVAGDRADNRGHERGTDSQRSQGDDSPARSRFPRPPSRNDNDNNNAGNDHGQPASSGNYVPAPKQREENPGASEGERHSYGRGAQRNTPSSDSGSRDDVMGRQLPRPPSPKDNGNNGTNNPSDGRLQGSSAGSYYPAPKQRDQNPRVNDGERTSPQIDAVRDRRANPASERPTPSPSNNDRGAGSPPSQQDRTMMRQAQVDHRSDSHPSQPAPRMAEPQKAPESARAPQPESRPAPSKDSGANGNSRGSSQFQERGHGKSQDVDPK